MPNGARRKLRAFFLCFFVAVLLLLFLACFAIGTAICRSPKALQVRARTPQKSQKGLPGPRGPEYQKSVEKAPTHPQKSQKGVKISVRGLF